MDTNTGFCLKFTTSLLPLFLQIMIPLNQYRNKADLLNAISFAYEGGTTNSAAAINLMVNQMFTPENGDRPTVSNE